MIYFSLLLNIFIYYVLAYEITIMKTPIISNFPFIKLHDVVIFKDTNATNATFAIDFTPIQQNKSTIKHLLIGKNIPAKIRIIQLRTSNLYEEWLELSQKTQQKTKIKIPLQIEELLNKWMPDDKMNFYTHNCKHFSHFFHKKLLNF